MVSDAKNLEMLERIARLRAERELKKFSAFCSHMISARQKVSVCERALQHSYESAAPLSVAEARIASAQAARSAYELNRAIFEVKRKRPA